jgi:2',3'-cyclic-nucleotide 2'-phosphodiesterase/3'-nucleotidase
MTFPLLRRWLLALGLAVASGSLAAAEEVTVTFLETSDLHGNLLPWDYLRSRPSGVGLARVATRVAAVRRETPHVLLLDGGDTIEGAPPEFLQARRARFSGLLA